ncbi:hypothetical protein C8A01DRAFT_19873 [Parachaetomium inaequale]|uniref:Uncharacterized protein n=1 Tax=Parachaetomium inaequale TaxID=2588326 RepID=A0AAN6P972_9PEZI|nr:hypothetical protein C8A01DRAFT_19873 [Parachaetomium inaequale]
MARLPHLANKIPWNALASNFRWVLAKQVPKPIYQSEPVFNGELQLRCQLGQGEQLHSFVDAMVRTLREHSTSYRKKYPERYEPAHPHEIIIDDATVRKITPTVYRWCSSMLCPIPHEERRAAAFYRERVDNDCMQFEQENGRPFYNIELVKTLLLYGEMDIILRLCAYPEVDLRIWQTIGQCYCLEDDAGWDLIYKTALLPYIALNLIHCFPETWDRELGRTDEKDYRRMRAYSVMVNEFTEAKAMTSKVAAHPHWEFFGINERDRYINSDQPENPRGQGLYTSRSATMDERLTRDPLTADLPTPSDTLRTQQILRDKGLPAELVSEIMDTAEYGPIARLEIRHDPFHPANRDELAKYVKYCWQLLVRCDMMATALGRVIPWHELISNAMAYRLIGDGPDGRKWFTTDYRKSLKDENAWTYTFLY